MKKQTSITKRELMTMIKATYNDNAKELATILETYSTFFEKSEKKEEPQFLITRINDGLAIKCFKIEWVEFDPETKRATNVYPHIAVGRSLIADRMGSLHTWMTTEVTKIITVAPNTIHFLTKNSEYKITKI